MRDSTRRIMVVDDHPVFRQGLVHLLRTEADLEVVAEAADAVSAMRELRKTTVDLVMVDLTLGGASGISLVRSIVAEWPDVAILVISMHDERVYAERSFRAGAHGYVMKEEPWDRILAVVRQVISGQLGFSPTVTGSLLHRHRPDATGVAALTDRELEVFDLYGRGVRTREVATRLHLSPKTVESHVASIKRKLGIQHTNEMVYRATMWRSNHQADPSA